MRKRRVIIFDDEESILNMLGVFFQHRNYDIHSFIKPIICPVYENNEEQCSNPHPCADVILTDYNMPKMDGLTLLKHQARNGCKLNAKNKALMSGFMTEEDAKEKIGELGCAFFNKPFSFTNLSNWIDECEERMDISDPVGIMRKEPRVNSSLKIEYSINAENNVFDGLVTNYSDSGLCMTTKHQLIKDQTIKINTVLPNSCRQASVRWARMTEGNYCVAGLSAP